MPDQIEKHRAQIMIPHVVLDELDARRKAVGKTRTAVILDDIRAGNEKFRKDRE